MIRFCRRVFHAGSGRLYKLSACSLPKPGHRSGAGKQDRRHADQLCGGSISAFASALCDGALSKQEIDQLRKLLEEDRL